MMILKLEREPLEKLSKTGTRLISIKIFGNAWTIKEKEILDKLWSSNNAIWLKFFRCFKIYIKEKLH